MGFPFISSTRRVIDAGSRRGGDTLRSSGNRLQAGEFRPRAESLVGDALAGAVQAGGRARLLARAQWTDRERLAAMPLWSVTTGLPPPAVIRAQPARPLIAPIRGRHC